MFDPERPLPPSPFDDPAEADNPVEQYRMPLLDHLRELRRRLIVVLAVTIACCALCFAFVQPIWDFLVAPMNDALVTTGRGSLAITDPAEGFVTYMKVAGSAGVGLASPVIFWQVWGFIAPGLYPKEQKAILPLVFASTSLFALGMAFAYFVIFEFTFPFFLEVTDENVTAMVSINSYLGMATRLLLAFGFCFQLPVVVYFLARLGLVNHRDLIAFFRYAIVIIFIVAAVMTPPDILSQTLMAGPLVALYGVGIVIARLVSTKPIAAPEAEG
jgi:sec-independent protein translocase protein TatC